MALVEDLSKEQLLEFPAFKVTLFLMLDFNIRFCSFILMKFLKKFFQVQNTVLLLTLL